MKPFWKPSKERVLNHSRKKSMPLIKDQILSENSWQFISDDTAIPDSGNITVSLHRWQENRSELNQRNDGVGVRLESTDDTHKLKDLAGVSLIELNFPAFTDGRLFSHAKLLRTRTGFQGEIRAVGNFMVDQVFYMSKVGINAFELDNVDIPVALAAFKDFSVSYQN
jgi:uncharacterized protein (DUF934 family)